MFPLLQKQRMANLRIVDWLAGDAQKAIWQLDTTLSSYQSLMEKLMVDISLVEKENARIVELIGDYLKDVHANLGKIDHNSTITVRSRPIKRKIQFPVYLPGTYKILVLRQRRQAALI